ncbi:hypothetical protein ACFO3D_01585 [Virgibacillus kekensis]|uniref:Uncharacterized protein n=1 Tax=Virgibacillus kekensis TaxID=202261 RepID=A0ABV9DDS2_9BACI
MRELIGECGSCGKPIYCKDGFFDGDQIDGKLLCNECSDNRDTGSN